MNQPSKLWRNLKAFTFVSMKTGYGLLLLSRGTMDYFDVVEVEETDKTIILYFIFGREGFISIGGPRRKEILFHYYPNLETTYKLAMQLKRIRLAYRRQKVCAGSGWPNGMKSWSKTIGLQDLQCSQKKYITARYTIIIDYFNKALDKCLGGIFQCPDQGFPRPH